MYGTILVPLDGSRFAEQALPLAATLARTLEATLELVRVYPLRPADYGAEGYLDAIDIDERERADVREYLNGIARMLASDEAQHVEAVVVDDRSVAGAICREGAAAEAGLVVMTTHGRTGLRRTVLGSVADGVVRRTTTPVLLWKPADAPAVAPERVRHVLVPLDGSPFGEEVLSHAAVSAVAFGARLTLLRVVDPAAPAPVAETPLRPRHLYGGAAAVSERAAAQHTVRSAQRYLDAVAETCRRERAGLPVDTRVTIDDRPGPAILRTALELSADLVAMATRGHGMGRLVTGSTVDTVVRGWEGALLLVRPPG